MARGNDSQAAAAEFRGQYGVMGNAEDLIQANRAAYPAELRSASLAKPEDQITDEDELAKVGESLGVENGKVIAARRRGHNVIAVVETESGHVYKAVTDAKSALSGQAAKASDGDPSEDADARVAKAHAEAQMAIADARAEAERIIAKAREDAEIEASKIAQAAAEKARKEAEKVAKDAEKAKATGAKAEGGSSAS
jgi:vacuolar-type H+-ATPase subunit H